MKRTMKVLSYRMGCEGTKSRSEQIDLSVSYPHITGTLIKNILNSYCRILFIFLIVFEANEATKQWDMWADIFGHSGVCFATFFNSNLSLIGVNDNKCHLLYKFAKY